MTTKPPERQQHVPLGRYFLEQGRITEGELAHALEYKAHHGVKLGQALVALGLVAEEDLIEALRRQGKVHCLILTPGIVDRDVAFELGEKDSRRLRALAINRIARTVTVAMQDPSDVYAIDEVSRRLGSRVLPVFAEPSKLQQVLELLFPSESDPAEDAATRSSVDLLVKTAREEERRMIVGESCAIVPGAGSNIDLAISDASDDEADSTDLDKPVINFVRGVLEEAYVQKASDIHFEPRRDDMLVRLRVDGNLFDRTTIPKSWLRPVIARIKILANLDIAQRRLPQDGRLQFGYKGRRVDLRVATTPTLHGEGAVLRVLDGGRQLTRLEDLDLDPQQLETLERITLCREGFLIATGPTGSGKTTTLYAILQRLNARDTKIITLEDPVENEMVGVTQINANPKVGLTFAAGLRSILRQDPDLVLVGEIRDNETAEIAIQASLTGHIVLSTLHTNGAAESIARLADMGIEPYLLADTLRGIVAQRLVRRICASCKRPSMPDGRMLERLGLSGDRTMFYEGAGCEDCHGIGFKGRLGIYEIMQITPVLCSLIQKGARTDVIHQAALDAGLITLQADAIRKARSGLTTLKEVLAATTRG